ncbi:hypothetical protein DENIS_0291 [Desulfonema ishimotonii]|uniref:Uncharacterized protein n=1 Tax=Desulfonema ishimotonii TaxID=45657 RepID=A0A401FQW2_9BACT|nr:LamG domain-containing protein [Desulfonema ishimotonii]GBC59352.1 hypothetical protein DENIS_0291 [Desulfonema ishimotonii]
MQTLYLYSTQLSGAIPPELGNLASLQTLRLYSNQLSGTIPPELGNLASLQTLYLYSTQLSGTIPPELGNLASLQALSLNSNDLSGTIPSELGNLANLTILDLNSNQLSGTIPPELGNLASLQTLDLDSNALSGTIPPEIGNLASLQGLDLDYNQLSGCLPDSLKNLSLTSFKFEDTELQEPQDTDFQNWLAGITSLGRTNTPCNPDDSDGDTLPDSWEKFHFGDITVSDGTQNLDGDGMSDLQEYQNGTDPLWSADSNLADGLVAHYPFDGNAEEVAAGADGQLNGPVFVPDRLGYANGAAQFDGTDDWINVPGLNQDFLENGFSFNLWFKTDETVARQAMFWFSDDQPSAGIVDGKVYFNFKQNIDASPKVLTDTVDLTKSVYTPGQWNMATYTYDADVPAINFYLNGTLIGTRTLNGGFIKSPTGVFRIGRDDVAGRFFDGLIDDLKIYSRPISAEEIQQLLDSDNDKMPDTVEEETFGNFSHDETHDTDLDGILDWQEFLYGTDPNLYDEPDHTEEYTFTCNFGQPEITLLPNGYHKVTASGADWLDDTVTGAPMLPVRTARLFVPPGRELVAVRIIYHNLQILDGAYNIQFTPVPRSLADDTDGSDSEDKPDWVTYGKDAYYPYMVASDVVEKQVGEDMKIYDAGRVQRLHGNNIVEADAYPVMFYPAGKTLAYATELEVTVFTRPAESEEADQITFDNSPDHVETVLKTIDNTDVFEDYVVGLDTYSAPDDSWEYVIITIKDLLEKDSEGNNPFETLAEHRRTLAGGAYSTHIVTLESIMANYPGRDRAEQMRNFIIDAYKNHGTKFVVLGGIVMARRNSRCCRHGDAYLLNVSNSMTVALSM